MVNLTINSQKMEVPEGTTILEAIEKAGISVPTLCFLKEINEIAACRVCVVEVTGVERLVTSCNNFVYEGMEVFTNTPKVREARKTNIELILSQHHTNCPSCVRSGNCQLQTIANSMNLVTDRYVNQPAPFDWPEDFPLIRDAGKCIKCMRCIQICDKIQGMNIWDVANTGSRTTVGVSGNRKIKDTSCTLCGQCIIHCPTGALQERDDVSKIFDMQGILNDPNIISVVQIAPAVRSAWGEEFKIDAEIATEGRLVAALKKMGFHYVFDTGFSADLTVMEEGSEFLHRLTHHDDSNWPMFTSCCPGWIRFIKSQYPELTDHLSTAKSPQQMFGAITKTYFANKIGVSPDKIRCISIMPCVAKKEESSISSINERGSIKDVDFVLTTREICRMIKFEQIDITALPEEKFDDPMGQASGAAVIFGASGGVMEAALRTCYSLVIGSNPQPDAFSTVPELEHWREAEFTLADNKLKIAVCSGLANARILLNDIISKKVDYDFIEFMACPEGCLSGGGQPIHSNDK
ncbi:MAG: 2Fe-2S iron-sulfur cluster binding domain-containing protein, partial [Clostridiales bacterium]|nr:2Fe-2S iron-sulfur cluster binding domain-containing protein [Clostridiales bacterium]